ncbi:MAG: imidazole glycerol phosphate synthase subunit HisH [Selenomonadaceae bacterium]|nr:imidazole glycerol phosphate synthase subunit HisH [Selenomonadaceae bacterium]
MTALIDYGVGNLYSVAKAVSSVGGDVKITNDAEDLKRAEKIILPGVGAFGDCMKNLEATGLIPTILEQIAAKKFLLGICVGLQILFEKSEESPNVKGLGIFKGEVKKISAENLKIPHMGWNAVNFGESKIFAGLKNNSYFYFVHSYHAAPLDKNLISATSDYGEKITAAVESENIFATQFHPEKSGDVGLKVLKNFIEF